MAYNKSFKMEIEQINIIISKIDDGLTFKVFDENKEPTDEYFKENGIYVRGTFHYRHMPSFKNLGSLEELKEELETVKIIQPKLIEELKNENY